MGGNGSSSNGGKRRKSSITKREEDAKDDSLSSLPDQLLVDILSLLPIKTAAATSALSRRWRHLWPQVTFLQLHYLELDTVDHILAQLTSPKIPSLHLVSRELDRETVLRLVDSCFNHIRHRNVEQIQVEFMNYAVFAFFRVPDWVFKCQSLVSLKLSGMYLVYPDCIDLPNLRTLWLHLREDGFATYFFSSCPLLQDFSATFRLWENGHVVEYQGRWAAQDS